MYLLCQCLICSRIRQTDFVSINTRTYMEVTASTSAKLIKDRPGSQRMFSTAQEYIPGGVNSPVRAFRAVGGNPVFMQKAEGQYMWDVDGNRYLEFINSWGPMLLGHAHPEVVEAVRQAAVDGFSFGAPTEREVEMAELICRMVPSVQKVRMVNSGTEATMSAIRLARGFTGRDRIIKFEGCYHGHGDSFLIAAGSGAATFGVPDSPGVPAALAELTSVAAFNDLKAVQALFEAYSTEYACVIVEPVVGNMGLVPPAEGFLQGLRDLCTKYGALLIFDEVMTGFRLAAGGAQEKYGVMPDLTTLGKIIGGGLPVGAYGGRSDVMDFVSPKGPVYQAGTLSGNPIAMAAGLATLRYINSHPELYFNLEKTSAQLEAALAGECRAAGVKFTLNRVGSMFTLFFTDGPVTDWPTANRSDREKFAKFFQGLLSRGVYIAPSQFESLFVSIAVGENDVEVFRQAAKEALNEAFA